MNITYTNKISVNDYNALRVSAGWGEVNHKHSIDLMSAIGKETFYEKFGFVKRPRDRRGAGMDLWLDKE